MKDCAVQFYINGNCIEDTELISRDEADALWEKHVPAFKEAVKDRESAEMALWVDMKYPTNYRTKAKHWRSADMIIDCGYMYMVIRQRVA